MNSLLIFNILMSLVIYYFIHQSTGVLILIINLLFNNNIKYMMQIGYDIKEMMKYQFHIPSITKDENLIYITNDNTATKYITNNTNKNNKNIGVVYNYLENIDFTISELIYITKSQVTINILLYKLIKADKYFIDISLSSYITDKKIPSEIGRAHV